MNYCDQPRNSKGKFTKKSTPNSDTSKDVSIQPLEESPEPQAQIEINVAKNGERENAKTALDE